MKLMGLLFVGISMTAHASDIDYAAVTKNNCYRMQESIAPFILVLDKGDNLIESINQCALDAKLKAASISALGQVYHPTLAYFSSDPEEAPKYKTFSGVYELASLNGNISHNGSVYYTHVHGALANEHFEGITGHIAAAEVGMTVEVTILPFANSIERVVHEGTGFGPIVTH